jgi:hypothetical protein
MFIVYFDVVGNSNAFVLQFVLVVVGFEGYRNNANKEDSIRRSRSWLSVVRACFCVDLTG